MRQDSFQNDDLLDIERTRKMESNLETEKNAESKEETTSPKAVKTNVNWFDSKSVQQLSERLAAIIKVDKRSNDAEDSARKVDLKGMTDEHKRNIENLFSLTAPREDANDCLHFAYGISYLLYVAEDKDSENWLMSIVDSISDKAFVFHNMERCVDVTDKMTGKQIKSWFEILCHAMGETFLTKLIFKLPYRCWGNIERVLSDKNASNLLLDAVRKEFAEKHVSADLLYWLWKNDDDSVNDLRNDYLTNAALLFKTLRQDLSGNYLKAQRDLRKLLLEDSDFQITLMKDGDKGAVLELIRCTKRLSLLSPQERQSLLVHIFNLYPQYKDAIEERNKGPVRVVVGRLTSKHGFNKRTADLEHLIKVEIPENSKAIEVARAHGDLRENSEFKFAKEQQRFLNSRRREWEESLNGLQVTDFSDTKIDKVIIPGCTVVLKHDDGKVETLHLLGLLDGDADKDIISFDTPLGKLLLGNQVGAELTMPNGGKATVAEIKPLSPEMLKYVSE